MPPTDNDTLQVQKKASGGWESTLLSKVAHRLLVPLYLSLVLAVLTFSFLRTSFIGHITPLVQFLNNFFHVQWEKLFLEVNGDQFFLHVVVSWVLLVSSYWIVGLLFTALDVSGNPKALLQYKIQNLDPKNYPVPVARLLPVVKQVLLNQTVVAFPTLVVLYFGKTLLSPQDAGHQLPRVSRVVLEIVAFMLIEEVFFYYAHRFLHHPWVYKRYHKQHHEWTSPVAITAIYCHPIEHVLSNVLPTFIGPTLLGSHVTVLWLWVLMTAPYGLAVHSGYHLPLMPSPEMHDFHHLKFTVNFGVLGILDRLHGTDGLFRKSEAFKRHFLLLSLKSAKTLVSRSIIKEEKTAETM